MQPCPGQERYQACKPTRRSTTILLSRARRQPLTPSQNDHRAYNIAAARIGPLNVSLPIGSAGMDLSALEKLLREAEAEMKALEQK